MIDPFEKFKRDIRSGDIPQVIAKIQPSPSAPSAPSGGLGLSPGPSKKKATPSPALPSDPFSQFKRDIASGKPPRIIAESQQPSKKDTITEVPHGFVGPLPPGVKRASMPSQPTIDPTPYLDEPIVSRQDHVFKSPHQSILVEWEDPSGKVTRVHTHVDYLSTMQSDPKVSRIVSIYDLNKRVMVYDVPTTLEWETAYWKANPIVTQHPSLHQEVQSKVYTDKPLGWSPVREIKKKEKEVNILSWEYQIGQIGKKSGSFYHVDKPSSPYVYKPQVVTETIDVETYRSQLLELQRLPGITTEQSKDLQQAITATYEWHPETKIVKEGRQDIKYRVDFPYTSAEKYRTYKSMIYEPGGQIKFGPALATAFTGVDPLGLKSAYYTAIGEQQKVIDTKIQAIHGTKSKSFAEFYFSMPTTQLMLAGYGAQALGTGVGAITAVGSHVGTVAKIGTSYVMGGLFVKGTAPTVIKAYETGDYGDVAGMAGVMPLMLVVGYSGYKSGYAAGYGRVESYLYGKHTYASGTPEMIRFKSALKVSRSLEHVKSHKASALDIAKDIMRMDPKTAQAFIDYYRVHGGVIGGSAASYTQILDARGPRDLDYFMQRLLGSTEKKVASAKHALPTKTETGQHLVDIHGKEMYKPGQYYRFGFVSQKPIRIGNFKFVRAGELLFRKGEGAVALEKQITRGGTYPGFPKPKLGMVHGPKDISDFVVHAKSLIISAKKSYSPLNWLRAETAQKNLDIFLDPSKSKGFGKPESFFGRIVREHTKLPVQPEIVIDSSGNVGYVYPKYVYSKGIGVVGYFPSAYVKPFAYISSYKISSYKQPTITPSYKPPTYKPTVFIPSYKPKVIITKTTTPYKPPTYKPTVFIPPYKPKVIITKTTTPYKPPPYEPPYKSPLYKSQHKKLFDFGGFIPKRISIAGKRRKTLFDPSRWRIHPVEMEWDLVEDLL